MPRSRKEKRQHYDSAPEQRARVIKSGMYDGSNSSRDFVVSGHSTGSSNTEMEALSHQVSIDAGRVPDYPVDDYSPAQNFTRSPLPLTESSSSSDYSFSAGDKVDSKPTVGMLAFGGLVGAAGAAALSYLALRFYENYKLRKSAEPIFDY